MHSVFAPGDKSSDAVWSGNNHTNTYIILAGGNYNDLKVVKALVNQFLIKCAM
jgi:hypothetical protein